jgi:hypothetical protein
MGEDIMPSDRGEVYLVSPLYQEGDTVVFKYEGNVRARVVGSEVVDGRVWLRCRAELEFEVPASHVVAVEREEG